MEEPGCTWAEAWNIDGPVRTQAHAPGHPHTRTRTDTNVATRVQECRLQAAQIQGLAVIFLVSGKYKRSETPQKHLQDPDAVP